VSGGTPPAGSPVAFIASIAAACAVAAVAFVLGARGSVGPLVVMLAGMVVLAWRAWLAARAFGPILAGDGIDRGAAMARFRRVPFAAAVVCLVLGLAGPLLGQWTGFEGSVATLRGQRTIEFASDPALFWFTSAIWYAVSSCLLWFCGIFAWTIERMRRDPRVAQEMLGRAGR
jgi:hypothetical protein